MTYSIVARDPVTGELGVAVQSHWFAAGAVVPWAEAGVGAVATQAMVEIAHGPNGLARLREGGSAPQVLEELLSADRSRGHRQLAIVDAEGGVAVHTGSQTIPEAGHHLGDTYSTQANMMRSEVVWDAMAEAYEASEGDLARRMLDALDAAEAAGGDIRGRQAAGLLLVRAEPTGKVWLDEVMRLHVDDHPAPLIELRRLVEVHRVYDLLQRSEDLQLEGDEQGARAATLEAMEADPANPEAAFWGAIALAEDGRVDEARAAIQVAFAADPGWPELLRRLAARDLVDLSGGVVARLLS